MIVDPSLHVLKLIPFAADGSDADALFETLDRLPHPSRFAGFEVPAPVLVLPNVFDTTSAATSSASTTRTAAANRA